MGKKGGPPLPLTVVGWPNDGQLDPIFHLTRSWTPTDAIAANAVDSDWVRLLGRDCDFPEGLTIHGVERAVVGRVAGGCVAVGC